MDSKSTPVVAHDENPDSLQSSHRAPDPASRILGKPGEWEATLGDAQAASARDHSLTVREAIKSYPWAVFWSLMVSMSVIMEGYDTILIGSLYGYPSYARQFGSEYEGKYQIPAKWQSAMGSGPQAGAIIGAVANGLVIQKFGFRIAFMVGLLLMTSFAFVSFFGMSVELQAVGQILCGSVIPGFLFLACYYILTCPFTPFSAFLGGFLRPLDLPMLRNCALWLFGHT